MATQRATRLRYGKYHLRRGSAVPVHVHSEEDEICVVIEGSGSFWVGEKRRMLTAGDVIFLPRDVAHAYRFTGSADFLTGCIP
jgi:quercetin dioxygenase-like cupin family protein